MIDAILRGLIMGGSIYAGAHLGEKYLEGATEQPIWTGHVNGDVSKPAIALTQVHYRAKTHYRVYVTGEGQWAQVAGCWQYAEALAAVGDWERYLCAGGSVGAWQAHNYARAEEVADMEAQFANEAPPAASRRQPPPTDGIFTCHPDGTVDGKRTG
jgi:hypothetical protein